MEYSPWVVPRTLTFKFSNTMELTTRRDNGKTYEKLRAWNRLTARKAAIFRLQALYSDKLCRKCAKIRKMWALRPSFRDFLDVFPIYKPYGPENSQDFEQWAPPYSAQVAPSTQDCYDHTSSPQHTTSYVRCPVSPDVGLKNNE